MKAGADGNIVNEDGWTMDSIAIKQEHLDVISIINQFRYPQYYAPNGEFRVRVAPYIKNSTLICVNWCEMV
jgi:hypothetical protein